MQCLCQPQFLYFYLGLCFFNCLFCSSLCLLFYYLLCAVGYHPVMNESKICYCVWLKTRAETITQVNPVIWLLKIIEASFNPVELCSTFCLSLFLLHNALLRIHYCNIRWGSERRHGAGKNVRNCPLWDHLRLKRKETFVQCNNCKAELAHHNSPTSFRVLAFKKSIWIEFYLSFSTNVFLFLTWCHKMPQDATWCSCREVQHDSQGLFYFEN